ncbi:riboflavin kinase [Paenarthrobacter nitroguajacolicus]|uniref:riboflavin kinase n=1 Tax=Paenarthrobacter nitroguajacolicus TaxID=211146 RepID=UPI003D2452B0
MTRTLQGIVEHGDARGRQLGFPTANLQTDRAAELDGVWAGFADVEGFGRYMATVSIGHRPTYYPDTAATLVEVHLLDFDADIYGCRVAVELTAFLRGQVRCANEQELVALIAEDVRVRRRMASADTVTALWPWMGQISL